MQLIQMATRVRRVVVDAEALFVRTHPTAMLVALFCTSRGWHVAITAFECSWQAKKPHRNFAVPVQPRVDGHLSIYLVYVCLAL